MKIELNNTTKVITMTFWVLLNGIGLYFKLLSIAEFSIIATLAIMWLLGTKIKEGATTVSGVSPIDEFFRGKKIVWEKIGGKKGKTERAAVPGGWLVRVLEPIAREVHGRMEYGWEFSVSVTFVPDPEHIGW